MSRDRTHPALELIRRRRTAERFDAGRTIDEATVRELVRDATRAPSSFNIQHWRFLAVRDAGARRRLQEIAFGQPQVGAAAVTFVVLGDVRGAERLREILDHAVAEGGLPEGKASAWEKMAAEIYADEALARDEALRSGSLAAMTLMLAAEARGLVSGALTGFDPRALAREFAIPDRYLPVMLVTVGYPAARHGEGPPMGRLEPDDVLAFDRWPDAGERDGEEP